MAFESQFSGPSSRVDGRLQRARKSWTRGLKTTPYRDPVPISSAPYGDAIASIDIRNISLRDVIPRIEHVEYAASYNWLDVERASILVPGCPPAWTPPDEDVKLKQDEGTYSRDLNASKSPLYPTEPAVRALRMMQPSYAVDKVHIFTCYKTMENLLGFVELGGKPFRIDVDRVGSTIFLVRKERSPFETIKQVRGYGHTFPDAYTTWEPEARNSISYQRIVSYRFGTLNCLVRSGTDCYERHPEDTCTSDEGSTSQATNMETDNILIDVPLGASEVLDAVPPADNRLIIISAGGKRVPQCQIFDIKTRNGCRVCEMDDFIPRLWLTQTPKLLLAYHRSGVFERPRIEDCRDMIREWEQKKAVSIGKLHNLLQRLVNVMSNESDPRAEVSWDGRGSLRVTKQIAHERRALPDDLMREWVEGMPVTQREFLPCI